MGIYPFDASKVDYLRTLSGKQEQVKSGYFTMMAKQNEKQPMTPTTSTAEPLQDTIVPSTSSAQGTPAAQQDAIVPSTSSAQGTTAAQQQDAIIPTTSSAPLGTPQYSTPASMRPRDETILLIYFYVTLII